MKRYIAAALLLSLPFGAFADTSDDLHIKAAFAFGHRKMWSAAIDEAKAGHSAILAKYFAWEYLKDPQSDASFNTINSFIEDNPDWPDQPALLHHAEVTLMSSEPTDDDLDEWFKKHPQSNLAKHHETLSPEELRAHIREAWVKDDYDTNTEKKIFAKYHAILRAEDHVRRIDRLLWEGRNEEAKRLMKFVPFLYQRLFQARLSLAEDKDRAPIDVVNVPRELTSDTGLLYDRLLWRLKRGDKDGVRELLLMAPADVPYPEKWWPIRDRQIREALGENDVKLAVKLLAKHGQKEGTISFKEVHWLSGWIALEYLNEPEKAYTSFTWLYKQTQTPSGKSRVAYWAGRAAEVAHKGDASHWYSEAAHYPTTFYGQVAAWEADHDATISIRSDTEPTRAEKDRFAKREMVQLIYALGKAHESNEAGKFILYLVDDAASPGEVLLATRLGREIDRIDFSVRAAKKALQSDDIVSVSSGWPVIRFSHTQGIETPLLLALSRQESEFFADAISGSGALGLMQLLPGTAKEIARKNDLSYAADKLFEPDYNMTIGSLYLQKMLEKFDGSYILAVASYNAGPGRIGQWLDLYGRPGSNVHAALDWIERIPTTETRNYVQHVFENMQVYRYVLAGKMVRLTIDEDLLR